SNVPSLGRSRVSAGSSRSRSSAVFITVMSALRRNDMAADAIWRMTGRRVSDSDEYFGDVQSKRYRCPPILLERHAGASALKITVPPSPGQFGTRRKRKITHRFP